MQISITERHVKTSDDVKSYAREKAEKLLKFYDRISAIEIVMDGAQNQAAVEIIVKADGTEDFFAQSANGDFFASVDLVISKLERQITKHKDKHRNRKHLFKNPEKEA